MQTNNIVQIFWIKFSFSFPAESQPAHQRFPLCKAGWERRYFCLKTFQQTWQPRVFPRQLLWGQLLQTTAGKKFTWRCFSTFFISSWSASRYSCQMSITETHNLFSQQNPWREKNDLLFLLSNFCHQTLFWFLREASHGRPLMYLFKLLMEKVRNIVHFRLRQPPDLILHSFWLLFQKLLFPPSNNLSFLEQPVQF